MKFTNKYDLPSPLVSMMTKEHYSKGKSDYSVTEVIAPAKIARLREQYEERMEKDVTEMMYSFLGTALHARLEDVGDQKNLTLEERLFVEINGETLSGAIDIQEDTPAGVVIWDYKYTSVWSVMNQKDEWVQQLNAYKYMVEKTKGKRVVALRICAFLRDWSARGTGESYPKAPIITVDLPVWSTADAEIFLRTRVAAHQNSKIAMDHKSELQPCTPHERWETDPVYAVMRKGRKSAIKLYDNPIDAEARAVEEDGYVEKREGEPRRCAGNYCGVAKWCKQYQDELKDKESF